MLIKYADHHKWVKILHPEDVFGSFGESNREKLKSTLTKIDETNISSIVRPVDENFLTWFLPMYTENIAKKDNPVYFPIREKVLGGAKQYLALEVYENNLPIGGTIFSLKNNSILIAYRALQNNWNIAKLRSNPALYSEYLIEQYARNLGSYRIVHGRDRNPYGINSGIGLANFKLSMGCSPYLSSSYEISEFDTENCSTDVLIFTYPDTTTNRIEKGYLITSRATLSKWLPVTKYPDFINVEIIFRD